MSELKVLTIYTQFLPNFNYRHVYMRDGDKFDYLGQILCQIEPKLAKHFPEKMRFPSELQMVVYPFTCNLRGAYHDTCVTTEILRLDKTLSTTHETKLNEILNPHGFKIVFDRSFIKRG